ncbi:hypothetical protein CELD12_06550 [Cellulomonas sp. NTE-D12]|nr:hypothetical protein CELD12_06550 [Cellulomonas sp. NTE-D12]
MWTLVAAVFALIATIRQAMSTLRELSERDSEFRSAVAIRELHDSQPSLLHPMRRREHRRILDELKHESPSEARAYGRVYGAVWSWALLATSALMAAVGSAIGLVHGAS